MMMADLRNISHDDLTAWTFWLTLGIFILLAINLALLLRVMTKKKETLAFSS
jgi:hypothetical protein